MQVNHIDVQLLGHFFSNQVLTRNFGDQPAWHSFCINVLQMQSNAIPAVDFSQKKILVVPSLDTEPAFFERQPTSRYQFYTGCSLHPRTNALEVHFYACEPDLESQVVLQNALIVLSIPKDEPFRIVKDKFGNKMANLEPSLNSLFQNYIVTLGKQETLEKGAKVFIAHGKPEEGERLVQEHQKGLTVSQNQYEAFLLKACEVKKIYLGKCLNP